MEQEIKDRGFDLVEWQGDDTAVIGDHVGNLFRYSYYRKGPRLRQYIREGKISYSPIPT
jgi:hypothetical protein